MATLPLKTLDHRLNRLERRAAAQRRGSNQAPPITLAKLRTVMRYLIEAGAWPASAGPLPGDRRGENAR